MALTLEPIGIYFSAQKHPYDAARQPRADATHPGRIELSAGCNYEQALIGLAGFERIWVIFQFDRNEHWKPMVTPPRGLEGKVGVFATRSPYRPNSLGLSCVRLVGVEGRTLRLEGADLLDGTPVFDVKPYLPEADAFRESRVGWLEGVEAERFSLSWSAEALARTAWLRDRGVELEAFARQQLEYSPLDGARKRVKPVDGGHVLAYRTWRIVFSTKGPRELLVTGVHSGYSSEDLADANDRWGDKNLHREFLLEFQI